MSWTDLLWVGGVPLLLLIQAWVVGLRQRRIMAMDSRGKLSDTHGRIEAATNVVG